MKTPIILVVMSILTAGCMNVRMGGDGHAEVDSLLTVHGSMAALDHYDGTLLDLGLFSRRDGRTEIFHAQVGPFFSVGVGVIGARVQVLPFEFGVGGLVYDPRSPEALAGECCGEGESEGECCGEGESEGECCSEGESEGESEGGCRCEGGSEEPPPHH